jgi:hypothetical protein
MRRPDRGHGLFEASAADQRCRAVLRFLVEIVFVECEHLAAAHENLAVDDDGVGATAVRAIDEKLNKEINAGLADPKFKARLADLGGEVFAGTPAEFGKFNVDYTEKWAKVIRAAGVEAE